MGKYWCLSEFDAKITVISPSPRISMLIRSVELAARMNGMDATTKVRNANQIFNIIVPRFSKVGYFPIERFNYPNDSMILYLLEYGRADKGDHGWNVQLIFFGS